MITYVLLYSFRISVCKLCLTLNKNKKDASFKPHGNTTSQTRHIKIHHPTKPTLSQIVDIEEKMSSFTNDAQQTVYSY